MMTVLMRKQERFGRLVVVEEPRKVNGKLMVLVRCDCGTIVERRKECLKSGFTRSCGCIRAEKTRERNSSKATIFEGAPVSSHPLFRAWKTMIARCHNPRNNSFPFYGGRGISVCDRWRESFAAFVEDMGPRPEGFSIERIDNDGGYRPENCRWATPTEQARNTRRNKTLTARGATMTAVEWSKVSGVPRGTINYRRTHGWPDEDAIFAPVIGPGNRSKEFRIERDHT
jgi:hypothetical protein